MQFTHSKKIKILPKKRR